MARNDLLTKRRQLAALELLLTMLVAMNKMEAQETRFSYQGSRDHQRAQRVVEHLCRELGLQAATVEDEIQRLVGRLIGDSTLTVPNRTIDINMNRDLWKRVTEKGRA